MVWSKIALLFDIVQAGLGVSNIEHYPPAWKARCAINNVVPGSVGELLYELDEISAEEAINGEKRTAAAKVLHSNVRISKTTDF